MGEIKISNERGFTDPTDDSLENNLNEFGLFKIQVNISPDKVATCNRPFPDDDDVPSIVTPNSLWSRA